jgi:5-(carboxyamino)imidazole ribonucleotide mutase
MIYRLIAYSYFRTLNNPLSMVGIIMGSKSDLPIMNEAAEALQSLGVPFEITIVSAHRTPERMFEYATKAASRGIRVIIAGAGGAAHLPGMTASLTSLPVIGVPIKSSNSIDGWDSVLSILQMPAGVPVATVALNGARNAGILAAQIIGTTNTEVMTRLQAFKEELKAKVMESVNEMNKK